LFPSSKETIKSNKKPKAMQQANLRCACRDHVALTAGTVFHKTRPPLLKWFWLTLLIGRQENTIAGLSRQHRLEIENPKTKGVVAPTTRRP